MFLWAFSGLFLGVYVVVKNINIPVRLSIGLGVRGRKFTAL